MDLIGKLRSWSHFNAMSQMLCCLSFVWIIETSSFSMEINEIKIKNMAGWWYTYPSEKYEFVSWGYYSQSMEKEKNVPNHQPEEYGKNYTANTSKQPRDQKWCEHLVPHSWQFQHGKWWSTAGKKGEPGTVSVRFLDIARWYLHLSVSWHMPLSQNPHTDEMSIKCIT